MLSLFKGQMKVLRRLFMSAIKHNVHSMQLMDVMDC